MEEIKRESSNFVEIYPTKVGRRVLAFFADIILNLILSLLLFETAIFPLSTLIINYNDLLDESDSTQKAQYQLLYENNLLYFDENRTEGNRFMLSLALEDTNYFFVQFYCDDDNQELAKYDVFYNYYGLIRDSANQNSIDELNELYLSYGEEYFDESQKTINGTYSLKNEYIEKFKHNYIQGDSMSEDAQTDYQNFTKRVFLNVYNKMFEDIEKNDLLSLDGSISYKKLSTNLDSINNTLNYDYIICSYISFFLSSLLLFLVFPLITEKRETIAERILKFERVNKKTLCYIKKPFILNLFLLKMFDSMIILFLIPAFRVGISYIFSFPELYLPSLIGIVIALLNLFITAFTKLNTSLKEITTDSIVIDTSSLDYYYREKEKINGKWCLWFNTKRKTWFKFL